MVSVMKKSRLQSRRGEIEERAQLQRNEPRMCIDDIYGQSRRFELAQNNRQRVIPNVLCKVKRQNPCDP